MNERTRTKLLFGIIISLFTLVPLVFGLGVTPGRTVLQFQPGAVVERTFTIVNTESKEMVVQLHVEGELAPFVTLSKTKLEFSSAVEMISVPYTISMPSSFSKPGLHEGRIVAFEEKTGPSGTLAVGAVMGIATSFAVEVPYEGAYLDGWMSISHDREPRISVGLHNIGTQDLPDIHGEIFIEDVDSKKVSTLGISPISLASGEKGEVSVLWVPLEGTKPGEYRALATVQFSDRGALEVGSPFILGTPSIRVVDVSLAEFTLGEIAPLQIIVENYLGENLRGVIAKTEILNENSEVVARFESPMSEIPGMSKGRIEAFWDTQELKEGVYTIKVLVEAGDYKTRQEFSVTITEEGASFGLKAATGRSVGVPLVKKLSRNQLIALGVGLVVLINVFILLVYLRRRRFDS